MVSGGDVTNEQCVSELDEGCASVRLLSPVIDDLASELSSPVDVRVCKSMVGVILDICWLEISE